MKGKSMNSKLGLVAAATLALSSSAFASDNFAGFSAGLGLAAVGSELEITDFDAGDTFTDAQTSTVGLLDIAYSFQLDPQWAVAVGATYDLNNIQAGQGKGSSGMYDNEFDTHYSVYLQPLFAVTANTAVFAKLGYHWMDFEGKDSSGTPPVELDYDGIGYGFGIRTFVTPNLYLQAEAQWLDLGSESFVDSFGDQYKIKASANSGIFSVGYRY